MTEIMELEMPGVTVAEAMSGRYPFVPYSQERASLWLVAEVYEKTDIALTTLSQFPYPFPEDAPLDWSRMPMHNIGCELEAVGLEEILDIDIGIEALDKWLLENGIAPGQPFRIDLKVTWRMAGWEYPEAESDYEWDIVGVEYWEPEQVTQAWHDWTFGMEEWQNQSYQNAPAT